MSYTQQTWVNKPDTSTPLGASRMNHIEDGIAGAQRYRPLVTRTLSHSNGGQGSGLSSWLSVTRTQTGTSFGVRYPFRLPADATGYTVKLRNYDMFASANGASALTLDGMTIGVMAAPSIGATAQTGNFNGGTGTTLAGSGGAIPNTTSFLSISGVGTLSEGVDYVLGISFHAAASTTLLAGVGSCWYWNNATSAHNPATAASGATSAAAFIPLDIVIEYTTSNRKQAFIAFGDSIPEGAQGEAYYANGNGSTFATNLVPTPLHMSYLRQWEQRRGDVMVQPHCLFASTAAMWANSSYGGYTRMSTSGGQWDGAICTLGCNDIAGGTSFSTLQGYYTSVITNIRAIVGNTVPLYLVNIMPESFATGASSKEFYRLQMNSFLARRPFGGGPVHCIDADSAVRGWATSGGSLGTNTMDLALSSDGIHPSYQGTVRLADALMAAIP